MEGLSELRVKVTKDLTLPAHKHPWMIKCPMKDCYSPPLGINAACGWSDQETAMRVASRHVRDHQREMRDLGVNFQPVQVQDFVLFLDKLRSIYAKMVRDG